MKGSHPIVPTIVLLAVLILPGTALAVDEVGVFFDRVGDQDCLEFPTFSMADAYLLLLDPSTSIFGWECLLEMENGQMFEINLPPQALNVGQVNLDSVEFRVGVAAPLPARAVVQLAAFKFMIMGNGPAGFYLSPTDPASLPGSLAYADGTDSSVLLPMFPREIGPDGLVAGMNRPNCVPEKSTWGRVKTTYQN